MKKPLRPGAVFPYNRAIAALVAVMLVSLVVIDLAILSQQRQSLMREVKERALTELEQAATFMVEPLHKYQFADIEQFIQQWSQSNREVVAFQAITPSGQTLTSFQRPPASPYRFSLEKKIILEGEHLLTLILEKDFHQAEEILTQLRNRLIFTSFYISLALGITLWFVFRYLAIRPLEQEVSRRRQAELELAEANRFLESRVRERTAEIRALLDREIYLREIMRTVADINALLITSADLETLLHESCARFVRHGQYGFCWIGLLEENAIRTLYSSDSADSALALPPYWIDRPEDHFYTHPAAVCLRENSSVLDAGTRQQDSPPWRNRKTPAGLARSISLPLRPDRSSQPFGVLTVHTRRQEGFEPEERAMLEELAGDIGFAIASFRQQAEVAGLMAERTANYEETIFTFVDMIEQRDTYTAGHTERVASYSRKIAREMGLDMEDTRRLYKASVLHDIGKIATPDSVLLKPGKLSPLDHDLIKLHAVAGYEMLSNIEMYKDLAEIILHHHERYDGTGYPDRLQGNGIPLLSRIMAVADAFDAMTTTRIYKARKDTRQALTELQALAGKQFDPDVVAVAVKVLALVEVPKSITQAPRTELEKKRFSYFFNDKLTGLYNDDYLKIILQNNQELYEYKCLNILHLQNMPEYNKEQGWEKGNQVFRQFANDLLTNFPEDLLFRAYGNDFAVVAREHRPIEPGELDAFPSLANTGIRVTVHHVDLQKEKKYTIDKLEKVELTSSNRP